MTASELRAAYQRGERDFSGANLRGANLRGAFLSGAFLSGAFLSGHILAGPWEHLGVSPRGYAFMAYAIQGGGWVVQAGCQLKTLDEAFRYWGSAHYHDREYGRWVVRRLRLLWEENGIEEADTA